MANPPPKDSEVVNEPKTHSEAEISSNREAARETANKHMQDEATRITLEGSVPSTQLLPPPPPPIPPTQLPPPSSPPPLLLPPSSLSRASSWKILGKRHRNDKH